MANIKWTCAPHTLTKEIENELFQWVGAINSLSTALDKLENVDDMSNHRQDIMSCSTTPEELINLLYQFKRIMGDR